MATTAKGISRPTLRGPERLCSELRASWQVLSGLAASLSEVSSPLHTRPSVLSLSEAREQYETSTRLLLIEPLQQFMRLRPINQSLEAMRAFDREAASATVLARAKIDGRFQTTLSEAALDLCEPWRIWRSKGSEGEWNAWETRRTARAKHASVLLNEYSRWAGKPRDSATSTSKMVRVERRRELWWRQESAVRALLEMELGFRDLGLAWLTRIEELVRTLRAERAEMLSVTQKMMDWMEEGAEVGVSAPVESIQLATPEERLRGWTHSLVLQLELVQPDRLRRW